jgi:hypothetical protein
MAVGFPLAAQGQCCSLQCGNLTLLLAVNLADTASSSGIRSSGPVGSGLCSSAMLRGTGWQLLTDVSAQNKSSQ